jgi:hypothetical protein
MRKIVTCALAVMPLIICTDCALSGASDVWRNYTLGSDGLREVKEHSGTHLRVRDGYVPILSSGGALPAEAPLPAGMGALAGVCYVQSSGGKLRDASGYLPLAGAVVEVSGGTRKLAVRADREGYFLLSLPAGEYTVQVAGFSYRVTVEKGKTSLVALRGGKRMVD